MTVGSSESDPSDTTTKRIRLGISACLLGEAVRFDGGHKRDAFLAEALGRFVEWLPVCPEVECGFGTPRESMRLVQHNNEVRLVTVRTAVDVTPRMDDYARRRVRELAAEDLCGFVLKKDSPSCGRERVKVYRAGGTTAIKSGTGMFAARLHEQMPYLPIEEEGRLTDPALRDNFLQRVFAYARLRQLFRNRCAPGAVVTFHAAHKLMLLAHSPAAYQALGRLVARVRDVAPTEFRARYAEAFMAALANVAPRARHVNVLQHMAGYLTDRLTRDLRAELRDAISEFGRGVVPRIVPVTLLRHHIRAYGLQYLAEQLYLEPYPRELMPYATAA